MDEVEQTLMAMLKSVTTVSEQEPKLNGSEASTLEQALSSTSGRKLGTPSIDATKETREIGTDMMDDDQATVDIGTNTTQPQKTGQ